MFLGNDLVHWSGAAAREKDTRSRRTVRFIDRVLHTREHPYLERLSPVSLSPVSLSPALLSPTRVLWALWAAKEASYKAAVKAIPGLPFSPRSIQIEFIPDRPGAMTHGRAYVRDQMYEILWEYHAEFVHAMALGPLTTNREPMEVPSFSDRWKTVIREMSVIPMDRASGAVRRIALQLLARVEGHGHRVSPGTTTAVNNIHIVRNVLSNGRLGPPIFSAGSPRDDLDLSLTHDGPWGAAAILHRPRPASSGR